MTARHNLYRVLDPNGDLYRHGDGRTRFPYLQACGIARRINGTVAK